MKLRRSSADRPGSPDPPSPPLDAGQLAHVFAPPGWLREFGMTAWFLVGIGVLLVGTLWFLGQISSIVGPVVAAAIVAAVTAPGVTALSRHMPRAVAAGLVLLSLLVAGAVVALLVVGGIMANSAEITASLHKGADTISGWFQDLGVGQSGASDATDDVSAAVPDIGQDPAAGGRRGRRGAHLAGLLPVVLLLQHVLPAEGRPRLPPLHRPATWASRSPSRR